jgi:hypothetical protein
VKRKKEIKRQNKERANKAQTEDRMKKQRK